MNLIKKLRINKELTQVQFAQACGVSQVTVSQWEKGLCFPKAEKISTLSRVLECSSDVLLRMAEERRKKAG